MCIASFYVSFENCNNEHAMYSNLVTFALWVWTGPYTTEATKNICQVEGEGVVDHCTLSRWWKKFCSVCKVRESKNCEWWGHDSNQWRKLSK